MTWWYSGILRITENRFRQANLGTVSGNIMNQAGAPISGIAYRHPVFGVYWENNHYVHPEGFALWVDANLVPLVQESLDQLEPLMLPAALDASPQR